MAAEINNFHFALEAEGDKITYNNTHKGKKCMFLFQPSPKNVTLNRKYRGGVWLPIDLSKT